MNYGSNWDAAIAAMKRRLQNTELQIKRDFFQAILIGTPVDTGLARGGWTISVGAPAPVHGDLDPDAADGLHAIAAMDTSHSGKVSFYSNDVPYIIPLEYGYSRQAPQGMVRINIARFSHIVAQAIQDNK